MLYRANYRDPTIGKIVRVHVVSLDIKLKKAAILYDKLLVVVGFDELVWDSFFD